MKDLINVNRDRYSTPYPYCTFQFIGAQNVSTNTKPLQGDYRIILDNKLISNAKIYACKNVFHYHTSHCRRINTSVFHRYDPTIINEQIVQDNTNHMANEHIMSMLKECYRLQVRCAGTRLPWSNITGRALFAM